ncbi:sulfatase-like hydrolase/transferase [Flavicella marina]|uniref:sulfatase-like hydrolase/transferase n=1 Tax=Flavicella marina TaxID=1475951 RepID=UPI001264FBDD|nr:sulfatase-like hydrolase/transferase [Flavicella marina]
MSVKKGVYVCLILFVFLGFCQKNTTHEKPKQNVVLILIDDLSMYGVTAYGADRMSSYKGAFENQKIATPEIDKLASEGLMCTNAFAYPLCEATRIALMSGKYNNRNFLRCKSQHASDVTFGDVFQKEGYVTGMFGKWKQTRGTKEIHGKDYISEFGWDDYTCYDVVTEGQRFINPFLVENGVIKNYQGRKDLDPITGRRWYGPDICNRNALRFLEKNQDKPFFLYYPMLLVHDDHKPTPDTKPNAIFDNFDEANHNRNGHTGDDHKFFPDMHAYMDKLIGNVVAKLDALGLRENTLIIVMGDNGTKESFSHVLPDGTVYPGRKGGTTDNGLHVPLILNQPGKIPANKNSIRTYEGLVDVTDIFPTIAQAADVQIPNSNSLDGISFWPQVLGKKADARETIYTWYNNNQPYTNKKELLIYAFDKNFKRYDATDEFPNGRFFDLRKDPLEKEGDYVVYRRFGLELHSGLDLNLLDKEQSEAFDQLGKVINSYKFNPVTKLDITGVKKCKVGAKVQLSSIIYPGTATRKNIVWESSNPEIASINKFGELTATTKGKTTITIYSWDDAYPLSANEPQTYRKNGIQKSILFEVE